MSLDYIVPVPSRIYIAKRQPTNEILAVPRNGLKNVSVLRKSTIVRFITLPTEMEFIFRPDFWRPALPSMLRMAQDERRINGHLGYGEMRIQPP